MAKKKQKQGFEALASLADLLIQEDQEEPAAPAPAAPLSPQKFSIALFKKGDKGTWDLNLGLGASFPEKISILVPVGEEITGEKLASVMPEKGMVWDRGHESYYFVTPVVAGWQVGDVERFSYFCREQWKTVDRHFQIVMVALDLVRVTENVSRGQVNSKDYSAAGTWSGDGMGHDDGFMHQA